MIHYHGGPFTPSSVAYRAWASRHAFVSFAHPEQTGLAADICQSFALDNGAFSIWKQGREIDWEEYYTYVRKWKNHPGFDFAVVPDVIEGTEDDNDALAAKWPFPKHQGAVVWHINESIERFERLCKDWPRVAIGSSGDYDVSKPSVFLPRAIEAIKRVCDDQGRPKAKLHGLRMLNPEIFTKLPLASADSTNASRNCKMDANWRGTYLPASIETRAQVIIERIEAFNGAGSIDEENPNIVSDRFKPLTTKAQTRTRKAKTTPPIDIVNNVC